jgi:hypothetical protein
MNFYPQSYLKMAQQIVKTEGIHALFNGVLPTYMLLLVTLTTMQFGTSYLMPRLQAAGVSQNEAAFCSLAVGAVAGMVFIKGRKKKKK